MPAKQNDARRAAAAAAADEQANRCSCGHHYGRNEHDSSGSQNDAAAADISAADSVAGSTRSTSTSPSRPLDASFVQVPQHDYSTDRSAQQLHQEEQQKHGADARCSGKAESYRRLVRLQQAANYSKTSEGGSSALLPPALCLYCIHR